MSSDSNDALIIRSPRGSESPYFATARHAAQDMTLTYEARGMLWYLLSKPDNWETRVGDLMKSYARRDKTYNILRELREHGYITRPRTRNAGGSWVWGDYQVHESPVPENERTLYNRSPLPALPDTGSPDTVKPDINTNKRGKQKRESNKGIDNTGSDSATAPDHIKEFIHIWVTGWAGVPSGKPYGNKTYRADAANALKLYTLEDVQRYTKDKAEQAAWKSRRPSWATWFNDIGAWLKANPNKTGNTQHGAAGNEPTAEQIAQAKAIKERMEAKGK